MHNKKFHDLSYNDTGGGSGNGTGGIHGASISGNGETATAFGGGGGGAFDGFAYLLEVYANGVSPGAATSSVWTTRTINTIRKDDGNLVSLTGNSFTLQPGSYEIEASAPAFQVDRHRIRMIEVNTNEIIALGTSEYTRPGVYAQTRSYISTQVSLISTATFSIEHYFQDDGPINGMGVEANFGYEEIFTWVKIWKEDGGSGGGGAANLVDSGSDTNLENGFLGRDYPLEWK